MAPLDFDFSGVSIRVSGLTAEAAKRLEEEWRAFRAPTEPSAAPFLCLEVQHGPRGVLPEVYQPKAMRSELTAESALFELSEGSASLARSGPVRVHLASDQGPREPFTLQNLLRACLAWRLPQRGAALLHAAGLAVDGRAFVLVGRQGAGKTTWAEQGRSAGAQVISDDLVLVECLEQGARVLGTPLCSDRRLSGTRGCWPLEAILFARHGTPAALSRVGGLTTRARIAANLPFVVDAVGHDDHVARVLEGLSRAVPQFELTFGRDPSFVGLLRELDAAS
jgi:hypothetical protein